MAHAATFIKGIRSRDPGIAALCEFTLLPVLNMKLP